MIENWVIRSLEIEINKETQQLNEAEKRRYSVCCDFRARSVNYGGKVLEKQIQTQCNVWRHVQQQFNWNQ